MCTGLEPLLFAAKAAATVLPAVASIKQGRDAKKAGQAAEVRANEAKQLAATEQAAAKNAEAERTAAAAKSQQNAMAANSFARKSLQKNSLFTGGGESLGAATTQGGRVTLGV